MISVTEASVLTGLTTRHLRDVAEKGRKKEARDGELRAIPGQ
jgi:hypothetical protein